MSKPTILTFTPYYLPGYKAGGPVRSLANIVDQLGDEFDFRILTLNHDLSDEKVYDNIDESHWNTIGKASTFYFSDKNFTLKKLKGLLKDVQYHSVYFNSFFHPKFTIKPLLYFWLGLIKKKNIVIAPRGEFSEGALDLKPFKKRVYISFFKILGIYKKVIWQASSSLEKNDIERAFKRDIQIIISPNLPTVLAKQTKPSEFAQKGKDKLRIIFLSRIARKKNLLGAIEILKNIKSNIELHIYGPQEDNDYWLICKKAMELLPENIKTTYKGTVKHEDVSKIIAQYDLFFFPTLGENFGHVIFESLMAGCPVLISDQTPWKDLEKNYAGFNLALNETKTYQSKIEMLSGLSNDAYLKWRQGAQTVALNFINDKYNIEQNRLLFSESIKNE